MQSRISRFQGHLYIFLFFYTYYCEYRYKKSFKTLGDNLFLFRRIFVASPPPVLPPAFANFADVFLRECTNLGRPLIDLYCKCTDKTSVSERDEQYYCHLQTTPHQQTLELCSLYDVPSIT